MRARPIRAWPPTRCVAFDLLRVVMFVTVRACMFSYSPHSRQVVSQVRAGHRMAAPAFVSKDLAALLKQTWAQRTVRLFG